jgi:Tol biopolymer transport system component
MQPYTHRFRPAGPAVAPVVLALLMVVAARDLNAQGRNRPSPETTARIEYVATVRQDGPVGYRDPVGAISPDGTWLAYSSGRKLWVRRVAGGPVVELGRAEGRFTALTWHPNSRHVVAREQSFDRGSHRWYSFDALTGSSEPLFADDLKIKTGRVQRLVQTPGGGNQLTVIQTSFSTKAEELRELTWSPNGQRVAGLRPKGKRTEVWVFDADGGDAAAREIEDAVNNVVWHADNSDVACLTRAKREIHTQLQFSCGGTVTGGFSPVAYGPFAFSTNGQRLYYAAPNERGTLDLWARGVPETGGDMRSDQLTQFTRDAYAPSVTRDGAILFKTQDYKANIAVAPAGGGSTVLLTTFQSETPSWHWDGSRIAFTFGSWRRATDDLNYPDISQNVGYVTLDGALPRSQPNGALPSSGSEDQGAHWSPNGAWIAYHSHGDDSDDIWLRPAEGRGEGERISDDGHETGWPRWSPDGRWIVYASFEVDDGARRSGLYRIGVNQETGDVTADHAEIPLAGSFGDISMAEWSPDSQQLVFESDVGSGTKGIYVVSASGGTPTRIHEFESEQMWSGISVSPDFEWVAYIAPGDHGRFQVWRVPIAGGEPEQLTFDPTDKAHPSYSPDGNQIAFTVFNYEVVFWLIEP